MINFDIYTMPDGKRCVRSRRLNTMTTKQFLDDMEATTTATKSDGLAVLSHLGRYIARNLRDGNCVNIEGLGSFAPSYKLKEAACDKDVEHLTGNDVELKRVVFRASPELREKITDGQMFKRVEKSQRQCAKSRYTIDERRQIAVRLAQQSDEKFRAEQYRQAAGISMPLAYTDLALFVSEGVISVKNYGRYKLYGL